MGERPDNPPPHGAPDPPAAPPVDPAHPPAGAGQEPGDYVPARVGCRSDLRGWAGAHLHGAVRPRRRAAGRGRPPGRWC